MFLLGMQVSLRWMLEAVAVKLTEENLPAIEARLAELNIKYHVHRDASGHLKALCREDDAIEFLEGTDVPLDDH